MKKKRKCFHLKIIVFYVIGIKFKKINLNVSFASTLSLDDLNKINGYNFLLILKFYDLKSLLKLLKQIFVFRFEISFRLFDYVTENLQILEEKFQLCLKIGKKIQENFRKCAIFFKYYYTLYKLNNSPFNKIKRINTWRLHFIKNLSNFLQKIVGCLSR